MKNTELNTQLFQELEAKGMDKETLDNVYRTGYTKDANDYYDLSVNPGSHKDFDDYQ